MGRKLRCRRACIGSAIVRVWGETPSNANGARPCTFKRSISYLGVKFFLYHLPETREKVISEPFPLASDLLLPDCGVPLYSVRPQK